MSENYDDYIKRVTSFPTTTTHEDMDNYIRDSFQTASNAGSGSDFSQIMKFIFIDPISGLINEKSNREEFTKNAIDKLLDKYPNCHALIIHTDHYFPFGKGYTFHSHVELPRNIFDLTTGFEVYVIPHTKYVQFQLDGDGGFQNWCFNGEYKRDDKYVIFCHHNVQTYYNYCFSDGRRLTENELQWFLDVSVQFFPSCKYIWQLLFTTFPDDYARKKMIDYSDGKFLFYYKKDGEWYNEDNNEIFIPRIKSIFVKKAIGKFNEYNSNDYITVADNDNIRNNKDNKGEIINPYTFKISWGDNYLLTYVPKSMQIFSQNVPNDSFYALTSNTDNVSRFIRNGNEVIKYDLDDILIVKEAIGKFKEHDSDDYIIIESNSIKNNDNKYGEIINSYTFKITWNKNYILTYVPKGMQIYSQNVPNDSFYAISTNTDKVCYFIRVY